MQKFPILAVVKEALKQPFEQPLQVFKAVGLMFLAGIAATIVMLILMLSGTVDPTQIQNLAQNIEQGKLDGVGSLILLGLIVGAVVFWVVAFIFNYWVRLGAYGLEGAAMRPLGAAWSAAGVNMVKLLLISVLLGVVSIVVWFILNTLGIVPSFSELMQMSAQQDIAGATKAGLANSIVTMVISCFVYSFFSANLTQTALASDQEGLEHPHTTDFAIVLVLLYAVLLVPSTIAGLIGSQGLMLTVTYVLDIYLMLAIAAAHGLRYRICMAERNHAADMPQDQA